MMTCAIRHGPRGLRERGWRCGIALFWLMTACVGLGAVDGMQDDPVALGAPVEEASGGDPFPDPEWGVGPWIWGPETHDKQTCRFWRSFHIPQGAKVARASIRISVDNGYRLMLNGRQIGIGSDWRSITEYDLGDSLKSGRHVVAVEAFNDNREAGLQFGMRIELEDGRRIAIFSDTKWRVVPPGAQGWETAHEAPAGWDRAVEVGAVLPRPQVPEAWLERVPTMLVKVTVPPPVKLGFLKSVWFQAALWVLAILAGLICLRLMTRLAMQSKARELLNRERSRIARDIHDELGARLTELALEGEVIQTELPPGSPAGRKLDALCEKARAASGAMDELVWVLNSRRDTLRDFATYACKHVHRFLVSTSIRCRLDIDPDFPDVAFELPVRRSLLLGVKEAVHNAVKHSGATELLLRIYYRDHFVQVMVEDNGAGFDLDRVDLSRNGVTNMIERMKEVGGRCRISTRPGAGCKVEFEVPLEKRSIKNGPSGAAGGRPLRKIQGKAAGSAAFFGDEPK
jgi:signal transduction histidine kinase